MRAAIFRKGDFVVDDIKDPTRARVKFWLSRSAAAFAAATYTRQSILRSSSIAPADRAIVGCWIRNVTSCSGMSFAAKWWIMVRARTSGLSLALWSARCR